MSYAARTSELFRRVARQIDRILRGESPGSIPIERPTTFELVVNPDSAKVIGLTLPPSLLRRADRVLYHLVID